MKELAITLDTEKKQPLYEQIYEALREAILQGRILQGEKLPSTRFEADYLQVSRSTVELAYDQLVSEGYIHAEPYRGYFACDVRELYDLTDIHTADTQSQSILTEIRSEIAAEKDQKETYRIDFSLNALALESFPYNGLSKIMKNLLLDEGEQIMSSGSAFGEANLKETICDYLFHARNVRCVPEQIVIGAGTEYLYHLLIQLLGRDHVYGIENPGYQKLAKIYAHNGVDYRYVDLDAHGLSMESLRKQKVEIIHTSPTHHFPTGIAMPISRRQKLLAWAAEKEGRYIIEDDYDCEFRFGGLPIPTLQSIDGAGRVIYLNTFSKSLTPSIRISYMVLPRTLVGKFQENLGFYACTVSNFEQYTLAAFLQQGYFEKHINRMRNFYKNHRNQVIAKLKESRLWQMASIYEEDAGLHFLLHIDTQKEDSVIKDQLQQRGIRLRGMSDYTYDGSQVIPHTFIINYTAIDPQDLPEVLEEIYQVCIN